MPRPIHELAGALDKAREQVFEVIADAEFHFAQISAYPATIPIFKLQDRELVKVVVRRDRKVKLRSPVAYLHFDGEHLSFSQVALPFPKTDLPRCQHCKASCPSCLERQQRARKRWNEREAAKTKPVEVLNIEDGATLSVVCGALPEMHKRLVDDSKVTPEEIEDAIRSAQDFLAALKA